MSITLTAPAKINLALHVVGQRGDGYHLLDSLVIFADCGDVLTFKPSDRLSLTVCGPFASQLSTETDNLVLKAARRLAEHAGLGEAGAQITLEKNLPIASGIGGGSADAAATLLGLADLWSLDRNRGDLLEIAKSLGADVPMCLSTAPLRVGGIGDELAPIDLPPLPLVLVNPMKPVSTPSVFTALERKENRALAKPEAGADWLSTLPDQRNDLEAPAIRLCPDIAECLHTLRATRGCTLARMSGSGATCFGLYNSPHDAEAAADKIKHTQPHWWVAACQTHGSAG
ncbi:MAG: 4-(cytidine 5'-diphospho)-2-C-methyl-D-erythritol kinase [Ahrensia sp.]|nr:4-(cytidine 5'-diphospho)-2-C-methyl-D-erythritol kinase [Ahrensia sp.]